VRRSAKPAAHAIGGEEAGGRGPLDRATRRHRVADGPTRDGDACEPDRDPDHRQARQPIAKKDPAEDGHPDRHECDQERRDPPMGRSARRMPPARSRRPAAAPDDRAVAPFAPASGGGTSGPSRAIDQAQKDRAGQQEAGRSHKKTVDRVDRDGDPEIGRAPDDRRGRASRARSGGAPLRRGRRRDRWHRGVVQGNRSIGTQRFTASSCESVTDLPSGVGSPGTRMGASGSEPAADAGRQTRQAR